MGKSKYEKPKVDMYRASIRDWNALFGNRGRWPFIYVELYVSADNIESHYLYTVWAKLYITILYPILIICEGYKDANREVFRVWNQKKVGAFSTDETHRHHSDSWAKMERLVGRKL